MKLFIPYIILIVIILVLILFLYNCHSATIGSQRLWPVPTIKPPKELIVFLADKVMDASKLFLIKLSGTTIPSIFKNQQEREKVKQDAFNYFQKQFGLSNTFLNTLMFELTVNENANYHVEYISSKPNQKYTLVDGGYTAYIPKGMKLYGNYGGKNGVASNLSGLLAFGYYIFGENVIKYYGLCPLTSLETYDGNYTFVDCEVEVESGPLKGLKGKAQGIYINKKLKNGLNHIVIRNVLTFN